MNASAIPQVADPKLERDFVTPEGVALRLAVAPASARIAAFAIDAAIVVGALIAMTLLLFGGGWLIGGGSQATQEVVAMLWLVGFFIVRNMYFLSFELGERAATWGKRALRIRVAARDGGRLTPDAVIARNLLREVEIFLPVTFLFGQEGLTALAGLGWAGLFLLFPLLNRDRLRPGDLIAGTWVVRDPRRRLSTALTRREDARVFNDAELDAYGVYELQTLEDVLRRGDADQMSTVALSIATKIGRSGTLDTRAFLEAYYGELKARLESRLLMGRRRRDKHDAA